MTTAATTTTTTSSEGPWDVHDEDKVWVFNYGSNSLAQLRGRLGNLKLRSFAAVLNDFELCFCLKSRGWGNGAVASIAPRSNSKVHGSIVQMSRDEFHVLSTKYEIGYRIEIVSPRTGVSSLPWREWKNVKVFVAGYKPQYGRHGTPFTPPLTAAPTEAYLTAIRIHLDQHWNGDISKQIRIRSCEDGTRSLESDEADGEKRWYSPATGVLGLAAFAVVLNAAKLEKWDMPLKISKFTSELEALSISTVRELYEALPELIVKGETTFSKDTFRAITTLPLTQHWTSYDDKYALMAV
eukprot:g2818.t1